MRHRLLVFTAVASAFALTAAASPDGSAGLVVHEWGTFLAVSGSDGVSLDGVYHEEHALPAFVHARGRDQLRLRSAVVKGETPVIYFYTALPQRIRVQVGFSRGIWTQWYPQADRLGPSLLAEAPPHMRDGHIGWTVDVSPPGTADVRLPPAPADALWNHARAVDAAYVRSVDRTRPASPAEWERFIFYRGLGEAPLPAATHIQGDRLVIHARGDVALEHVYVVRVENGHAAYTYMRSIERGASITPALPSLADGLPVDRFVDRIAGDMAARLTASGLYEKEARAMVNTWRESYFGTEGLRVLFVLPQSWTDRFIPLQIAPQPSAVVRVMVGRIEVLTPAREARAEAALRTLASADSARRAEAFAFLRHQGRYVEPIVRRTIATTRDDLVRTLGRRLLLTDFVADLRASLAAAPADTHPEYEADVRAHLATLLRDAGFLDQARQEARAALVILKTLPAPDLTDHRARPVLRALARANDAAGNATEALHWYGEFVRFASAAPRCGGCHALEGPREASFFGDWWAGRKYAELARKTGRLAALVAAHEQTLATSPRDAAARLALGYLYERR